MIQYDVRYMDDGHIVLLCKMIYSLTVTILSVISTSNHYY